MYCPRCGEERISEATSFCSRCGYLLTGTAELFKTGGALPSDLIQTGKGSPRSRGIKHGIFLIILSILIFPVFGLLFAFGLGMRNPWPAGLVLFLLFGLGVLRIIYALMFEGRWSDKPSEPRAEGAYLSIEPSHATGSPTTAQLNPSTLDPISVPTAGWREEDDLEPASVTEETTHLLEKPLE